MSATASITDWISAISTAAIGLVGLFLTGWQYRASGFRPRFGSRVDANREAIELYVQNRGRAAGIVGRVAVISPRGSDLVVHNVKFEGFPDGQFSPLILPGLMSMRLIIETKDQETFPKSATLSVDVGEAGDRRVDLVHDESVSLFGLKSALPPRAET
jgi:hypothetical protein